jgi:TPR repeat protein
LFCPSCGKKNSDDNRFCGNCGTRLSVHQEHANLGPTHDVEPRADAGNRTPTLLGLDLPERSTHYPREGYEPQAEAPHVSPLHEEFPPEVIEYDKQVPLIAEPGSDRRQKHHFSSTRHDEYVERETPQRNIEIPANEYAPTRPIETRNESPLDVAPPEPPEPRSQEPYSSGYTGSSVLGLNTPTADEVGYTESAPTPREDRTVYTSVDDRPVQPVRDHFLDFSEPARAENSLHGPSFLGLSSSPEYYEEEETVSHGRRNFALLVLILLAILIAMQWRSIKQFGQQYAQGGGIHIPGMKTKSPDSGAQPANASTANANNSTAVNGGNAPAAAGATSNNNGNGPNIEVAPTQNPNAASANQQPQNNTSSSSGQTSTPPSADNNSAAKTDPAKSDASAASAADQKTNADNKSDQKKGTEVASNSKSKSSADNMPQGEPSDSADAADNDDEAVAATPAPKARATKPRAPIDDPSKLGAAELAQANAESDPASQIGWLWRATAKGNWEAPVRLADIYIQGRGVPADCDQAMVILRSAAAKKNARARSKLGSLYASGQCVQQDRVAAYHWMSLALQANPGSEWIDHNRQSLWSQMNGDERRRAARDRNQ